MLKVLFISLTFENRKKSLHLFWVHNKFKNYKKLHNNKYLIYI